MPEYEQILDHLINLYGAAAGQAAFERLLTIFERYRPLLEPVRAAAGDERRLTERDVLLIAYGDQVSEPGAASLCTLADFCEQRLAGLVSGVHILPFYPWSSDDGFSVVDYRSVEPSLGDWQDIERLGRGFRLMFDAVINHISAGSSWFKGFLQGDPKYQDYFITVEGDPDLSGVVRPRALPLLTRFDTPSGPKHVWTTFSQDQIDLNYRNPDVLLEIVDLLLFYAVHGADFIRLDAIAYLWKEIGSACIHLSETHRVIRLFRAVLDALAPHVMLITETNVPHAENLSYFGDGANEAQLVYNFALPPLVLHTFRTGSARVLSEWAAGLELPPGRVTFFNFLASHDGIGLNPARGLLSGEEIEALVEQAQAHGGHISYKHDPDGAQSPYELNINYFDALSNPENGEAIEKQVARFLASQAIMLSLAGMPGIYFHSLFGSRGWPEGVRQTGRSRTINRQKLERRELDEALSEPGSLRSRVFQGYAQLLRARRASPAFHPYGGQRILDGGEGVFAILRLPPAGGEPVLCLQNVTMRPQVFPLNPGEVFGRTSAGLRDLVSGSPVELPSYGRLPLQPYQALWLASDGSH